MRPGETKSTEMVTVLQQKNLHIPQLYPQKTEVVFLNFGTVTEGYTEIPEVQYVTITNTGTADLNF